HQDYFFSEIAGHHLREILNQLGAPCAQTRPKGIHNSQAVTVVRPIKELTELPRARRSSYRPYNAHVIKPGSLRQCAQRGRSEDLKVTRRLQSTPRRTKHSMGEAARIRGRSDQMATRPQNAMALPQQRLRVIDMFNHMAADDRVEI